MRRFGWLMLNGYRLGLRLRDKIFSLVVSGAFFGFGSRTILTPPVRITGERRIRIGNRVFLGAGCWLQALCDGDNQSVAVSIGDCTSIAGSCVISAVREVRLEESVLLAKNVYISDHIHKYSERDVPVLAQGVDKIRPVLIKRGAWLGQNVVVCPGVTIGAGAVVGANSVVNSDVPDFSLAVGAPARVIKLRELVAH